MSTKSIKEIKEKFQNHFDSGYLYLLERKNITKATENAFDSNNIRVRDLRCSCSVKTFIAKPSAQYVIVLGFRGDHNITKQRKDSITSFLRKKGFKYSSIGDAYYM